MKRIMLIAWRWRAFEKTENIVTAELLEKAEYQGALLSISSFKDILFDEFTVCEQHPDGSAPPVKPSAKVIRTHVDRIVTQDPCLCCQYMENLIEYCQQEPVELLIFLHRKDGFTEENINRFLKKIKNGRCFLIGGGRDNIYYREERGQGLLAEDGYFYRKGSSPGVPSVRVAKPEDKIVYLRYFDKVWTYYKHEFYTKIYELKEDILRHFYQLYPGGQVFSYDTLGSHLAKDRVLVLRAASFIDDEYSSLSEEERKELEGFAHKAAKSYEFDDLKANLENEKNITVEYESASRLLYDYFLADEKTTDEKSLKDVLLEINKAFTILLDKIKSLK